MGLSDWIRGIRLGVILVPHCEVHQSGVLRVPVIRICLGRTNLVWQEGQTLRGTDRLVGFALCDCSLSYRNSLGFFGPVAVSLSGYAICCNVLWLVASLHSTIRSKASLYRGLAR